jgi:tRNA dimethylallyltransferase
MVGGSGLYVEAVIRQYQIADVPEDPGLRRRLEKRPRDELVERLRRTDPALAGRTDLASRRRVIRALEIAAAAERGPVATSRPPGIDLEWRVYGLTVDRDVLRRRIVARLEDRIAEGMIDEVRRLLDAGISHHRLESFGLEYREISAYLAGRKGRGRMIDDLAVAIGRFAKRQTTWFRGLERRGTAISWITPGDVQRIVTEVATWVGESD